MRFVTFASSEGGRLGILNPTRGVLDFTSIGHRAYTTMLALIEGGDGALAEVREIASTAHDPGHWMPLHEVHLLAPIPRTDKNVFCVGRNYKGHIEEAARARGLSSSFPKVPEFFSKAATSIVGPDAGVSRHASLTSQLDYEVELGIIIGRRALNVTVSEAHRYIFGYTIINDISARDVQFAHGQWFKGKSLDTFCPMGPSIVTAEEFGDPSGHRIALSVNGEIRQDSTTSDLLFGVREIVASLSAGMTLEPGDVIATGTPSGVAFGMSPPRYLEVGDRMEAEVAGIGILRNHVVADAQIERSGSAD